MKLKPLILGAVAALRLSMAAPANATIYYIAPTGNDHNPGTSAAPWLTPNHSLTCGTDAILAKPGQYNEANFRPGNWGTVSCPSNNNVVWLKCSQFDKCKIDVQVAGHDAMTVTQSYWGVQGWEVHTSEPKTNQCFDVYPPDAGHSVHHVIFANNVANGCGDGGIGFGSANANAGSDYIAIVGNIIYNAAQDPYECYSGINATSPVNVDTNPGTHIYIAGNYSWDNVDPQGCGGGVVTDGQGIILDSFSDFIYTGQTVVENNWSGFNGATGFQNYNSYWAPVVTRQNTLVDNQTAEISAAPCTELNLPVTHKNTVYKNLIQTGADKGCSGAGSFSPIWTLAGWMPDASDVVSNNFAYSAWGNNEYAVQPWTGFAWGPEIFGQNPQLANPVEPPAPNCGGFSSVPACMAQVAANFAPNNPAAKAYGRQPVGPRHYDPLFPQWLCHASLPNGLVTSGCY